MPVQTAFPFVHLYQQSKNERLLLDYFNINCCPVYWNTSLFLEQTAEGAEYNYKAVMPPTLSPAMVVGADGARSLVRKQYRSPLMAIPTSTSFTWLM
jgi:2-polyprenyl-6-methoxyphenol hydroxylase-like FAD-dependent oxidoreductase